MKTFNKLLNGETGLSIRGKLNDALTTIISGSEGINAIWAKIESVINMIKTLEGGTGGLVKDTSYDPAPLGQYKSALLIALCTGTFNNLKDKNGTPITISGNNAITIFYRAEGTTYWDYDTHEIFPAVDSYEDNAPSKIESAKTHVITHSGTAIKPMTDFESVFDTDGNSLTDALSNLRKNINVLQTIRNYDILVSGHSEALPTEDSVDIRIQNLDINGPSTDVETINIPAATESKAGVMSAEDKSKLDEIVALKGDIPPLTEEELDEILEDNGPSIFPPVGDFE